MHLTNIRPSGGDDLPALRFTLISGGHKLPFVYLLPDEHGATYGTKIVSRDEQFRTEY